LIQVVVFLGPLSELVRFSSRAAEKERPGRTNKRVGGEIMTTGNRVYRIGPVGRVLSIVGIVLGLGNVPVHFINLFREPPETISWGMHVGASLFVMTLGAGMAFLGFAGLRTRMEVDAVGLRCGPQGFALDLDLRWDAVQRWAIRIEIETSMMSDEWGNSWRSETRREFLEMNVFGRPDPVQWPKGGTFYKEIVAELRARLPEKEDVNCPVIRK
jgi:hypothetical protein